VYGALGESNNEVKNDDRSRAGSVRAHAYSLGGYLTAVDSGTGLWADMVAQGSRHSLEATSADNRFHTRGWSWLGSLGSGLPLNIGTSLVLEPQVQYVYQSTSLDNGHDNGGYVNFGTGSAQHVRAGLRLGNQSDMVFGQGTSTLAGYESTMKLSAAELPVNWWVTPSVIRTFGSDGDLNMGT
ncbi:autotransporter outer membrane beta-barrel domain-containing protein, partial [Campylobacter sp. 2018MI27]|uniref:autotransporter outer membrane beta-barrel domain-containing protein n=1 Tax=Campylobacter sp. 2018MI27 TaxID=2836738 RepID=UPI001BD9F39F